MKRLLRVAMIALLFLGVSIAVMAEGPDGKFVWANAWGWVPATKPDASVTKWLQDKTGVYFSDLPAMTGDTTQALLVKMAANDLPDLITSNDFTLLQRLVTEGRVIPLDKYYTDKQNYPGFSSIDSRVIDRWRLSDGKIYNVPLRYQYDLNKYGTSDGFAWGAGTWTVRNDLLKAAGMKVADLATQAGVEKFLRKVKGTFDPSGLPYIPLGFHWGGITPAGWTRMIEAQYGVQPWNNVGGTMVPSWATSGSKAAWKWLAQMYRDGLLDQEITTITNERYQEKATQGRYAMVVGHDASMEDLDKPNGIKEFGDKNWGEGLHIYDGAQSLIPIHTPTVAGQKAAPFNWLDPFGMVGTYITTTARNPDKAMKFLDYLCTSEGGIVANNGIPGAGLTMVDNKTVSVDSEFTKNYWAGFPGTCATVGIWYFGWMAGPAAQTYNGFVGFDGRTLVGNYELADRRKMVQAALYGLADGTYQMAPAFNYVNTPQDGATSKYGALQTDIQNSYRAKMITSASDADFEKIFTQFIAEMKSKGHSDETTAEWNAAYQKFLQTPLGKAKFAVPKAWIAPDYSMPPEKNVPGVWYGSSADLAAGKY